MARMVVIGSEQFMLPFGALGFEMVEADSGTFPEKLRDVAADGDIALVVVPESLVPEAESEVFHDLAFAPERVVLVVPDSPVPRRVGYEMVRSAVSRAAGVDLLSSTEANGEGGDA